MKKIFTFLTIVLSASSFAQSSFNLYKGTGTTSPITNGIVISEATSASSQSQIKVKIKNISAVTHTYNVRRTIQYNAPALNISGNPGVPETYFCFGYACFANSTAEPSSSDYTILGAAGATTSPTDDSDSNGTPFKLYLEEGTSQGKYFVYYKVFDVSNPNDSISFTVKYNEFLSVNEEAKAIEYISDLYPNPATNNASFNFTVKHDADVKLNVHNTLGSLIQSTSQKYTPGKHKASVDCANLSNGIYFVSFMSGETKVTRRLIVNK